MTNADIRVGLIGYGFVGKTFHAAMITATPGMKLAAVASSRPESVLKDYPGIEVFSSPEDLIACHEIDLVVIATPNETHRPLAEAALRAGRNVLVDKPFMLSLADTRAVIETARQSGSLLSVFQNRRWDSDFRGVRSAIEAGRVGHVAVFESHMGKFEPVPGDGWRDADVPGGGMWFDLAPHMADQALQLFGLPDSITADIAVLRPGGKADDWFEVILSYPQHRVILRGSMMAAGGEARFTVHGSEGTLVKHGPDLQEDRLVAGIRPDAPGFGDDDDRMLFYGPDGAEAVTIPTPSGDQPEFYRRLEATLRGKRDNPVSAAQALAVMAVTETAAEAARLGQRLPLALTEKERLAWRAG
ncbi:oxidoreductase [Acetobacter sp. AN02]|uniref:oxidoreductase n=1 Tax=Acetobacter sp. AN02 TaxID=2894186 RepID=UPI00243417EE|nr:oxidoreductase [Acetobacter sp. AN02]MDG6095598.1 oxidoreductase [Acetobacter sp. AN02]